MTHTIRVESLNFSVEFVIWQGNQFNVTRISRYIPAQDLEFEDETKYYRLNNLKQEDQDTILKEIVYQCNRTFGLYKELKVEECGLVDHFGRL